MPVTDSEQIHKTIHDNLLESFKEQDYVKNFIEILKKSEAYIAGGSILSSIHNKKINDIDIYVNCKNSLEIMNFFYDIKSNISEQNLPYRLYCELNLSSSYENTFFKKNGLLFRFDYIFEFSNGEKKHIDLLVIENTRDIEDVIINFDLSFCSVYLKYTNEEIIFGGNIKDAINKTGILNNEYAKKYLFNKLIKRRINKYLQRGYKIKFSSKITSITKLQKEVTNSTIIYSIIKNIYYNSLSINLNLEDSIKNYFILYYFSSLTYDKEEFKENAKKFCKNYYFNENYYITLIYKFIQINPFTTDREEIISKIVSSKKFDTFLELYDQYANEISSEYNKLPDELKILKVDQEKKIEYVLENFNKLINKNITKFPEYFANILNLTNEIYEYLFSKNNYELIMKIKEKFDEKYKWIFNKELLIAMEYNVLSAHMNKYFIDKKIIDKLDVYLINENKNILFHIFEKQSNFKDYLIFITSFQDSNSNINYKSYAIKFNDFITNIKFFVKCQNLDNLLSVTTQNTNFFDWYYKLSVPQIFGLSFSEIIIHLSQYIYSNKINNIFYLYNLINIENISSVEAISIKSDNIATKNIFGDYVYLLSEKHCQGRTYDDLTFTLFPNEDIYYDMEKEELYDEYGNNMNIDSFYYEDSYKNKWFFDSDFGKFYKKIGIGDTIYSDNKFLYVNYLENSRGELWKFDENGQKYYENSQGIKIYDYNAKIKYTETAGLLWQRDKYIDVSYTVIKKEEDLKNLRQYGFIKFNEVRGYYIFDDLLFNILTEISYVERKLEFIKEYNINKNIVKNPYDNNITLNYSIKQTNTFSRDDYIIFSKDYLPYSKNYTFHSSNILPKIIDNSLLVYKSLAQVVYKNSDVRLKNIKFDSRDSTDSTDIYIPAYSEDPWKYFDTEYLIELFGDDLELIRDDLPDYRIKELQSRTQINPSEIKQLFMKYEILIKLIPYEQFNNFSLNSIIIDIIRQLPMNISVLNKLKNIKQDFSSTKFIEAINNILDLRETLENQINLIIDEYNEDYTEQNICYLDELSDYVYSINKFNMDFFNKMYNYEFTDIVPDECTEEVKDINIKIIKLKLIDYILSDYDIMIIQDIQRITNEFNNIFDMIQIILKITDYKFLTDNYDSIKLNIENIEFLSSEKWPDSDSESDSESDSGNIIPRRLDFIEDSDIDSDSIEIPDIRQEESDSD